MPLFALLFILAALPAIARAECPTRAALDSGATAYVTYPDESTVGLKLLGDGRVQETTRFPDGTSEFRMISLGGVLIVDEVDLAGNRELGQSRITSRFPDNLAARMPIRPHQDFTITGVNHFADGTPPEKERIELKSGGMAEIDIAGCRYAGFPLLLTYHWGDMQFTSMMTHLPDLGVSLELARVDPNLAPEPFAPVRFSLSPP